MINALEQLDVRRGRDIFVLVAALMSAMALELLLRRDWQASLPVMIALACIRPIRERPHSAGPGRTALFGVIGVALWLAIRLGVPAIMRGLA
jgi:hypothetical protein